MGWLIYIYIFYRVRLRQRKKTKEERGSIEFGRRREATDISLQMAGFSDDRSNETSQKRRRTPASANKSSGDTGRKNKRTATLMDLDVLDCSICFDTLTVPIFQVRFSISFYLKTHFTLGWLMIQRVSVFDLLPRESILLVWNCVRSLTEIIRWISTLSQSD